MMHRRRSRLAHWPAFFVVIAVCVAILAPGRAALAQAVGATPVVAEPTPTPDDAMVPPAPASSRTSSLVGPLMVSGLAFDRSDYSLTMGSTVTATLTISMTGPTTAGLASISLSPYLAPIAINATATATGDPLATCSTLPAAPGTPIIVQFSSPGDVPATCTVALTISGATLPGFTYVLNASAMSAENPAASSAVATVTVVPASTETLTLSVDRATAKPGDTVTVTASQGDPAIFPVPGSIIGFVPAGTTLVPGSGTITCAPMCSTQFVGELPNQVTGTYFPMPTMPLTATLTYQLRISDDVASGTVLTISGQGSTGMQTPTGPASTTVTVLGPLTAADASFDVPHGGTISESVSATGGVAPITFALVTAPAKGILVFNPNGTFTYTANTGATGTDMFAFAAHDASSATDTGIVTLTIAPAPLTAAPLALTVQPGTTTTGDLDDQVTGGVPPYTFTLDTAPTQGTVSLAPDGTFSYTANGDATGTDQFTYTVADDAPQEAVRLLATTTGTVDITFTVLPPTPTPTVEPTTEPTAPPSPTVEPTIEPTTTPDPTVEPTATVAPSPTTEPTATAFPDPTQTPPATATPTAAPTQAATTTPAPTAMAPTAMGLPNTGAGDGTDASTGAWLLLGSVALAAVSALGWRRRVR